MSDGPPTPPRIPDGAADDHDQWMAPVTSLSDHDIDELIAGRTPEGMPDLSPVAQVSAALREWTALENAPAMGSSLRQALADAPASSTRNHMGRIRRRLSGMAAVGVGALALGAATAANALPAPVQAAVSEAGQVVGIDLPHPDDRANDHAEEIGPEAVIDASGQPSSSDAPRTPDEGRRTDGSTPPATTSAGTEPADPGSPGDQQPATPADPVDPATDRHGLNPDGTAPGNGQSTDPAPPTPSSAGSLGGGGPIRPAGGQLER